MEVGVDGDVATVGAVVVVIVTGVVVTGSSAVVVVEVVEAGVNDFLVAGVVVTKSLAVVVVEVGFNNFFLSKKNKHKKEKFFFS